MPLILNNEEDGKDEANILNYNKDEKANANIYPESDEVFQKINIQ